MHLLNSCLALQQPSALGSSPVHWGWLHSASAVAGWDLRMWRY